MWHPSAPLVIIKDKKCALCNAHCAFCRPPVPKEDVSCVSRGHSLSFHSFLPITLYLCSYLTLSDAGVWMLQLTFICVHIGYCSPVDNDTVWVWQSVSKLDSFCWQPDMFLKRFPFVGHRFCRWRIFRKLNMTKTL